MTAAVKGEDVMEGVLNGAADGFMSGAITGAITGGMQGAASFMKSSKLMGSLDEASHFSKKVKAPRKKFLYISMQRESKSNNGRASVLRGRERLGKGRRAESWRRTETLRRKRSRDKQHKHKRKQACTNLQL